MSSNLSRQRCLQLKQDLADLQQELSSPGSELAALKDQIQQVQQFFQGQIASLTEEDFEGAIAAQWLSILTEMHKQMRLLSTDATFLQAARQPATRQQRQQQIRDRLQILIDYCDAVIGAEEEVGS